MTRSVSEAYMAGWRAARGVELKDDPALRSAWAQGYKAGRAPVLTWERAVEECALEGRKYTLLETTQDGRLVRSIFDDVDE